MYLQNANGLYLLFVAMLLKVIWYENKTIGPITDLLKHSNNKQQRNETAFLSVRKGVNSKLEHTVRSCIRVDPPL